MSGLRPPTRYTAAAQPSALNEITDSQANARAAGAMPPPQHGLKRPNTDYPQPDAKRKPLSLAERAGEFPKSKSHLPPPKVSAAAATKATSIVNLANQPLSRASSTTSSHSRHTSASSYAKSMGPGHRPQTSMGNNNFGQSTNGGRPRANTSRRPATAMSTRGPDPDTTTGSQCMNSPANFSFPSQRLSSSHARNGILVNPRLRPSASTPSFIPSPSVAKSTTTSRQSSLSSLTSKFGHMTISEEEEGETTGDPQKNGGQVNSNREKQKAATRADHRPGPRLSDTTVRAGRRDKVPGQ
ncbi:hypothetical protein CONLIGDRAFT_680499 [Coniochaeta ligniaria NRRL 30616]|uniref:Uncharacterized protein n=1 Tax=Coniochaeta ligniaria NRRL 30616 TaxID=1408157 RepID=A0A1J7IQB1_9PEZI|nr:hypothetical protein CONLIGDRAFT_680499 [Coniochaeta ligniaria NRRL 30616]